MSGATHQQGVGLSSCTSAVQQILQSLDLRGVDESVLAKRMGTSVRTLQRRLEADNSCFRKLMAQERKRRCLLALRDENCVPKALAIELGYSDVNSMYRAFRSWTGMSMREWRILHPPCGRTIISDSDLHQISIGVATHTGVAEPFAYWHHHRCLALQ